MNLYRKTLVALSIALLLACFALTLTAASYQHSSSHKLRATALLELTTAPGGAVTTHLVPITILANGRFQDASIYESRPRPLALSVGVVYEAQKTGLPVGYVTITDASHTPEGWEAHGKWQPATEVQASSAPKQPKPAPPPPADDRPVLHRQDENPQATPPPPSTDQQSAPGDDRPVLHRSGGSDQQSSSPASAPDTESTDQRNKQTVVDEPPQDDPNRPVLRRRTPASSDQSKTPSAPAASKSPASAPQPQTVTTPPPGPMTPGTQTFVAVSDAQSSDERSYEFHWKPEEQQRIEAKMRKLALAQLPGEKGQLNEHAMTNVVIRAFDVDLSNDAVVVITAEVPGGYLAPGKSKPGTETADAPAKFVSRYIAVIARVDIDGNPQKLAASVTDSSRLDVAPRLELIDAVDVDGDGLAELLFREYGFDQKSFVVYGVGHGTVTKVFEGASEPLK